MEEGYGKVALKEDWGLQCSEGLGDDPVGECRCMRSDVLGDMDKVGEKGVEFVCR